MTLSNSTLKGGYTLRTLSLKGEYMDYFEEYQPSPYFMEEIFELWKIAYNARLKPSDFFLLFPELENSPMDAHLYDLLRTL